MEIGRKRFRHQDRRQNSYPTRMDHERVHCRQRSMRAELVRLMDDLTGLWDSVSVVWMRMCSVARSAKVGAHRGYDYATLTFSSPRRAASSTRSLQMLRQHILHETHFATPRPPACTFIRQSRACYHSLSPAPIHIHPAKHKLQTHKHTHARTLPLPLQPAAAPRPPDPETCGVPWSVKV